MKFLYIYLIIINVTAVIVTVHDKLSVVRGGWRVKERTLLLVAALGGALMMYLTMLVIRHKTRKPKFMVGIPVILAIELVVIYMVLHYGCRTL